MFGTDRLHGRELAKEGLPPRDRTAHVPEHANSGTIWMCGAIAVLAVLALVMFGGTRTASNPNVNTEQALTTGAAPASSPKGTD
jgi:hypothetical protein